jgi:hypothetical protein
MAPHAHMVVYSFRFNLDSFTLLGVAYKHVYNAHSGPFYLTYLRMSYKKHPGHHIPHSASYSGENNPTVVTIDIYPARQEPTQALSPHPSFASTSLIVLSLDLEPAERKPNRSCLPRRLLFPPSQSSALMRVPPPLSACRSMLRRPA